MEPANPVVKRGPCVCAPSGDSASCTLEQIAKCSRMPDNPVSPGHYSRWVIQPITFIASNKLPFLVGNVIKYVMRYDAKNGLEDLRKARQYLDWLIAQMEGKEIKP